MKNDIIQLEGGFSCMLVAMHVIQEEWKKFESTKNGYNRL